ncbi:hypothetical protein N7492_009286 [Penicillium capsulatum]|uniref:Early meiotic induction protein 1 n=1 Tax=Penicillium capsulatum TaxID=69766 RepID=A0A9W9HTP8_9EURO|nr:hypothetical protein N7492_009286 [Penicillium capsulatum]KAJ6106680.1 hypothetical protein N7512_010197 [Penicillium capsulatum]
MGWWWSSSPTKDTSNNASSVQVPAEPAMPTAPQPKKLTPDEQADLEFRQILADLQAAEDSGLKNLPSTQSQATGSTSTPDQPTSSIAPESLYPDTMSCRNAFDYAFFCQSFGGQFVNVYRYGELRSCSEHWDNFWMCMRTRGWSDELRKKAIRAHNQKKAIKYKTGPSSEDIWDVRLEPAKDAFQGDFAALEQEMKNEEMQQQTSA